MASELRRLQADIRNNGSAQTLAGLPPAWNIVAPPHTYTIATERLRALLEPGSKEQDAIAWLHHLAQQLEGFSKARPKSSTTRTKLDRILARREFGDSQTLSAWEQLQLRIGRWIRDMLLRIFDLAGSHGLTSTVLFWILITGAVVALAWFVVRFWRKEETWSFSIGEAPVRTHTWEEWLRAASTAAAQGDLRSAIQCAYWGGLMRLQEVGALPPDVALTPREYLHLISTRQGSASAYVEALRTLTSRLERFWYGYVPAAPEDYSACLTSLEALGCKLR